MLMRVRTGVTNNRLVRVSVSLSKTVARELRLPEGRPHCREGIHTALIVQYSAEKSLWHEVWYNTPSEAVIYTMKDTLGAELITTKD